MESAVDFSNSPAVGDSVITVIGRHFGTSEHCINIRCVGVHYHRLCMNLLNCLQQVGRPCVEIDLRQAACRLSCTQSSEFDSV